MGFSIFQAYPELDGGSVRSTPRSSGLVSGQGAGTIALRRYADALRDGDRIHAVIRGVGLSNDGAWLALLVPNAKGQRGDRARLRRRRAATIERRLHRMRCDRHADRRRDGTRSLEAVFAPHGPVPLVGSVSVDFGHLLTAAGIASVIKTTMLVLPRRHPADDSCRSPALRRAAAPSEAPASSSSRRRGRIQALAGPVAVERARLASGTNAHLILEEFWWPEQRAVGRLASPSARIRSQRTPRSRSSVWQRTSARSRHSTRSTRRSSRRRSARRVCCPGGAGRIDARPDLARARGPRVVGREPPRISSSSYFLRARIPADSGRPAERTRSSSWMSRCRSIARLAMPGSTPAALVCCRHRRRGRARSGSLPRARVDLDWQYSAASSHGSV